MVVVVVIRTSRKQKIAATSMEGIGVARVPLSFLVFQPTSLYSQYEGGKSRNRL